MVLLQARRYGIFAVRILREQALTFPTTSEGVFEALSRKYLR
jgi:hypothetical protein